MAQVVQSLLRRKKKKKKKNQEWTIENRRLGCIIFWDMKKKGKLKQFIEDNRRKKRIKEVDHNSAVLED
jgi:hypothetical protein